MIGIVEVYVNTKETAKLKHKRFRGTLPGYRDGLLRANFEAIWTVN